jgi:hypothetical protein
VSAIAAELGGALAALDVNPLICGPAGVVAVDVLALPGGQARREYSIADGDGSGAHASYSAPS